MSGVSSAHGLQVAFKPDRGQPFLEVWENITGPTEYAPDLLYHRNVYDTNPGKKSYGCSSGSLRRHCFL
jgi:hypothetical protein